MAITRNMAGASTTSSQEDSAISSGPTLSQAAGHIQQTRPDQMIGNLNIDEAPSEPRQPRERDPPDLQDVVTQQTEILAGMLRARQAQPAAPAVNPAEPPVDPNFNLARLVLPPETNHQVPGDGLVQRMATSLFARVPILAGCDQHEARFVLHVISLWPDLNDEERVWAF